MANFYRFLTRLKFHNLSKSSKIVLSIAVIDSRVGGVHILNCQLHYVIGVGLL